VRVSKAVARFVSFKTAQGLQYTSTSVFLGSFVRAMGDCFVNELTPSRISEFLNSGQTQPHTRYCKYQMLCVFFRFLKQIEKLNRSPMPPRPPHPRRTYVPFIYSREEIRRIVKRAYLECSSGQTLIAPQTFHALVVCLYGTGISLSEALTLRWDRVDLAKQTVEVGVRECGKTRTIPIGRDVRELLRKHLASRRSCPNERAYVFVTRTETVINAWTLRKKFRSLCNAAGITRPGAGHSEPRLHDLRYTFAVHRISSWYKAGANTKTLIPALAVYMGRVGLWSTERLMFLTPEHFCDHKIPGTQKRSARYREPAS
jgi:integrase/recombinase XerD